VKDLYKILGVDKSASEKELKSAYRKLAKELHPDRNQGNEKVAEQFKEISAAYSIVGDKKQRARYDRGEIDASGAQQGGFGPAGNPFRGGNPFGGSAGPEMEEILRQFASAGRSSAFGGQRGHRHFEFSDGGGDDFFSDLFGLGPRRKKKQRRRSPLKGKDALYALEVPFLDAARGATKRLSLNNGKKVDVKIPPGVNEGQQIRLRGQGDSGLPGAPKGDALIEIRIDKHPFFKRDKNDIHLEIPITIDEAILGISISIPTIWGPVSMKIPKGTSSGKKMRLKGKGIKKGKAKGDQYVNLKIVLPEKLDDELKEAMQNWRIRNAYRVRQEYDIDTD
jgi:DnaJ-class molecular chaperone